MLRLALISIVILSAAAQPSRAVDFPQDTPSWRFLDALDELFDKDSAPLARKVACVRLMDMGVGIWALRLTADLDPDREVRAFALEAAQTVTTLTDAVSTLHDRTSKEAERLAACDHLEKLGVSAAIAAPALRMASLMDPSETVRARAAAALRSVRITLAYFGRDTGSDEIANSLNPNLIDDIPNNQPPRTTISSISAPTSERALERQTAFWEAFAELPSDFAGVPQVAASALINLPSLPTQITTQLVATVQQNIDDLTNGPASARLHAALRLTFIRRLSTPAIPALTKALKDEDADVRDAAASFLNTPQAARIAQRGRWIDELSSDAAKTRTAAVSALAADHFAADPIMKTVTRTMTAPPLARTGLVAAIVRSWREEIDLDQALNDNLRQTKDPLRHQIAAIAVKIVQAASTDESVYQAERAAIISELKKRLASANASTSLWALHFLTELGIKSADLTDALSRAVLAGDSELRHQASQALMEVGNAGLPAWSAMLKDPRREVRGLALVQLGRMGASARFANTPTLALLEDKDPDIRRMAAATLRAIAPDDPRVIQRTHAQPSNEQMAFLLPRLRSPSQAIRIDAAHEVSEKHLLPQPVAAALVRAIEQGDFVTREGLVLGIERAWPDQLEVEAVLNELSAKENNQARHAYIKGALKAIVPTN